MKSLVLNWLTHCFHCMFHTERQFMTNVKHRSTTLGVVGKLSCAVVKELLVDIVHNIYRQSSRKNTSKRLKSGEIPHKHTKTIMKIQVTVMIANVHLIFSMCTCISSYQQFCQKKLKYCHTLVIQQYFSF